jgi:hypothetical protein
MKKLICESCQLYNQDTRRCAAGRILPTKKNTCGIFLEKDPDEKKHGGARPGAGRPKKRDKEKKQVRAFALSAQVVDFIDQYSRINKLSKSQAVELIIKSCI